MPDQIRLVFSNLITGSNTNGKQFVCKGEFGVIIDRIPADAPQDWELGPKQRPGDWGVYRAHGFYPSGHGPYAIASGKTPREAFDAACSCFAGRICQWPRRTHV
jgi:hypothetical protein